MDPSMKTYVMTTGALFGVLTILHVMRMVQEGRAVATDPFYIGITALAAALCLWAVRLIRTSGRQ
jgi:hypothetical protein